jgi:hypothetical protein
MLWSGVSEPFGVASLGRVQSQLSLLDDLCGPAIMQHFGSEQGDPAVVVLLVVPRGKCLAVCARVLDGAVALSKIAHALESFELALRVRVVVRDMGPTMGFCHAQIGH